jgi:hypothetical protein
MYTTPESDALISLYFSSKAALCKVGAGIDYFSPDTFVPLKMA